MEKISQRLKRLREAKGISIKEMANELGIAVTTYREWEYDRSIQGEPYQKIAEILGVGLVELLTGQKPSRTAVIEELEVIEEHLRNLRKHILSFF
jgi:transcriptional regulator with XRE-family HTH domain